MSDFQASAIETSAKLTLLVQEIDKSQVDLESLEALVTETSTQIDTQWNNLTTRSESILTQLNTIREQIKAEVTEVEQALNQLQQKITSTQSEIEQEFGETKTSFEQLDNSVETSSSAQEQSWQQSEQALNALQEKSQEAESELDTAFSETSSLIQEDFITAIQTCESDVVQRTETLHGFVTNDCLPQISEKSNEFSEKLTQMSEQVDQKLQEISTNVENSTSSSLDQASSEHNDKISALLSTAKDLSQALEGVEQTVDQTSTNAGRSLGLLKDGTDLTNTGLITCVEAFDEVRKLIDQISGG